jgi:hypothetical protein
VVLPVLGALLILISTNGPVSFSVRRRYLADIL